MSVFIIALIEKFRDWLRYRGTLNALRQRTDHCQKHLDRTGERVKQADLGA